MNYPFIVLQTDFGLQDNYVGVMKGVIYKINPRVKIIDLTHSIQPQNFKQAGLLLHNAYAFFPEKTIFINVVDPGVGTERDIILLQLNKHIFMAPDNGLLSLLAEKKNSKYYKLILPNKYIKHPVSHTFHGRDIFAPIASYLSQGVPIREIAKPISQIKKVDFFNLTMTKNELNGEIIYIDHFGNLITNIDKELFFEFVKLKNKYSIKINHYTITSVSNNYNIKEKVGALFNSFNLLEIFTPNQNAKELLKIDLTHPIKIMA